MTRIITAIGFNTDNASMAERLLDWIYQLNSREQRGHCLLVCDMMVNEELQKKVRIAAEVAFAHVELVIAGSENPPGQIHPGYWTNLTFRKAADFISSTYRWPWVWLEPDCAPTNVQWLEQLESFYEGQPKMFAGLHMKTGDLMFMHRVGVYPNGAISYFSDEQNIPIEIASGEKVFPRCTKCRAFQYLTINDEDDLTKVRLDAAVVVGDVAGILVESLRESRPAKKKTVKPQVAHEQAI